MFNIKNPGNTGKNKTLTEGTFLDGLCELAVDRHFQNYLQTASKYQFTSESNDLITTNICEALVKDLEHEIWLRIAPKMLEKVGNMKKLALEATGGHKRV
ncbi:MAG: hypothetical protein HW411_261 [Gammaproteobacteria bacterium]|nr:hypothetical protein [Gammaproteobacteria bacterium]